VDTLDDDFHRIADRGAIFIGGKLLGRDHAFRLIAEIDEHAAVRNAHHFAFDEVAGMVLCLLLLELFEDCTEIYIAALRLLFARRGSWRRPALNRGLRRRRPFIVCVVHGWILAGCRFSSFVVNVVLHLLSELP
jgi:hypothetical protein